MSRTKGKINHVKELNNQKRNDIESLGKNSDNMTREKTFQ